MRRRSKFTTVLQRYIKVLQSRLKALQAVPQEKLIIIGTALLIVIGIPVFFLTRNTPSPIVITDVPPVVVAVPFTKLTQGTQSVVARRVNYVLTSSTELSELWRTIDAPGKPPRVDFKKNAVLAVFAGNESGTSISVAKIEDTNTRMVSIAIAKPNGPCELVQPAASPYEIVTVPTTSLHLTHEDISTTVSCPK